MTRQEKIIARLTEVFHPSELEVIDESAQHKGHAGAADGRGHFAIKIISEVFKQHSRVQQQRMIYEALGTLMQTDIHALRIISIKS